MTMKYTLRQLEVFLTVAHHENVSRAAEVLAMSQSACSAALKDLENQFNIQLFDRVGKRLQLNDFGRALQPRAEELLERAAELETAMGRHNEVGPLKIGATLSIGNYLAVPLINQYMERFHSARVSLEVGNTQTINHKVSNFELDVGLIEGEIHNPQLDITPWKQDELVVFCAPQNPLAKIKKISDQHLLDAHWILRESGSGTRQAFDRAMHDLLPGLNILLELQHTEAIKRAVEANMGLGCLSMVTVAEELERKSLVPLKISDRDFKRWFYLILHKEKYRSAGIEHWLQLCTEF